MFRKSSRARLALALVVPIALAAAISAQSAAMPQARDATVGSAPPLLHVVPSIQVIPIGATTQVALRVEDVQDLFGFETVIQYDPLRLTVIDADPARQGVQIQPGPFLQPANPSGWFVINSVDSTKGEIHIAITRVAPLPGVSGSGVLASIAFRGVIRGHSEVAFSPIDTLMLDSSVLPLPFTAKDGGILIGPVHRARLPIIFQNMP